MINNKYITFSSCGCSPPSCPEIEFYENINGEEMLMISDDQQHCCTMTIDEFKILANRFLDAIKRY